MPKNLRITNYGSRPCWPVRPCGFLLLLGVLLLPRADAVNVLTQDYDLARTGANTAETVLTPSNVGSSAFGKLFENTVDGQVYAQPLFVENLNLSGGKHNVVFVCTENNSIYAFDADVAGTTYWHVNLGKPFPGPCGDLTPVVGITGTPVIDLGTGTLYVDTKLAEGPAHLLHALDISTGAQKFGGPKPVAADGFNPSWEHQRTGLLLLNGVVYVAFGSHCDQGNYHGFLLGYNAANLSRVAAFNVTPTGGQGAIWSGGRAPAADSAGNIYVMTGNGTFDGKANFGESMIKLNGNLSVLDYATPAGWANLNATDNDFGAGGPVLVPPHFAVGIGKAGFMYLADTGNLGHVGHWRQHFSAQLSGNTIGSSPIYWRGPDKQYLFVLHANSKTKSFVFTGTNIVTEPAGIAEFAQNDRCGGLALSANGPQDGIVWEMGSDSNLRAYDAVNFPKLLWAGSVGSYVKMTCPTIANGKVYVGTSNSLGVWGLRPASGRKG